MYHFTAHRSPVRWAYILILQQRKQMLRKGKWGSTPAFNVQFSYFDFLSSE
jgi:hypothetical protein